MNEKNERKEELIIKLFQELDNLAKMYAQGDISEIEYKKKLEKLARWLAREMDKFPISVQFQLVHDLALKSEKDLLN